MEQDSGFAEQALSSGVQVVGQRMRGVESAALGFLIGTGSRDEQPAELGISHFTEQMLFRGTEHMDARALSDRMDELGISYDSSTGVEMTLVSAMMLGDRMPEAIDLLADVVRHASFPQDDVDNVRALLIQERRQREDRPGQKVMELLRQRFFAGSPISHDVLGTEETIEVIGRDNLVRYWADRYTAKNIIVSVAGNVEWQQVVDRLEAITASWPAGRGRLQMELPQPQRAVEVVEKEAAQENLGFAFPGVPTGDDRFFVVALAVQALGGGSNSRLFQEVREKRGLAYSVQARFDGMEKAGIIRVYCGTSAERAQESVEVILQELSRLEQEGLTEEELTLAKTRLKSQIIMRSESTSSRMVANLRSWWFERRLRSLPEIRQRIDSVSLEDVHDVVGSLGITDRLTAVAVGPRTEEELFGATAGRALLGDPLGMARP